MRLRAIMANSAAALLALSGAGFADVTVSHSNNPNSGYAAGLRQLFDGERALLQANVPTQLRSFAPLHSMRPAARPADLEVSLTAAAPIPQPNAKTSGKPGDFASEWACLTEALYFEARGESLRGQHAVAEVILNRVSARTYPNTVCGVVRDGAGRSGGCQFSYACDGKPEVVRERSAWETAAQVSRLALEGKLAQVTNGATHFHTSSVRPSWAQIFPRTAKIGAHLFYRQPGVMPAPAKESAPTTATPVNAAQLARPKLTLSQL